MSNLRKSETFHAESYLASFSQVFSVLLSSVITSLEKSEIWFKCFLCFCIFILHALLFVFFSCFCSEVGFSLRLWHSLDFSFHFSCVFMYLIPNVYLHSGSGIYLNSLRIMLCVSQIISKYFSSTRKTIMD